MLAWRSHYRLEISKQLRFESFTPLLIPASSDRGLEVVAVRADGRQRGSTKSKTTTMAKMKLRSGREGRGEVTTKTMKRSLRRGRSSLHEKTVAISSEIDLMCRVSTGPMRDGDEVDGI